jgi:hypothetical protein
MDVIRPGPQVESTAAAPESRHTKAPDVRFTKHNPRCSPSLTIVLRQVLVQSLVAVLLALGSILLWSATFGGFSALDAPPSHGVQHDFGLAPIAIQLSQ